MTPYLSEQEIADMCKGLKQKAARIRYLRSLGLSVEVKPDGSPLVWRASVDQARGQKAAQPKWSRAA